jgi:predicted DsbA family dithiol-disulfide isomerase
VEVERLRDEYDVEIRFAPYLLDPSIPPEGRVRQPRMRPDDPPSNIELRGAELGLVYTRGRTRTPNSHLALEAAEFAADTPHAWDFHRAMLKAYFEDLADIGDVDVIAGVAVSVGLDGDALRAALASGEFRQHVDDGIRWCREVGLSGVPTFIFDDKYAVVGAQEWPVFEHMMKRLGQQPRPA